MIRKYQEFHTLTSSAPRVLSLNLKNIFNRHTQLSEDRLKPTVPTVLTLFKKGLRRIHAEPEQELQATVPTVLKLYIESFVKFLSTFGGDETVTCEPPTVLNTSPGSIKVDPLYQITIEDVDGSYLIKWVNPSVTYNGVMVERSDKPLPDDPLLNEVGRVGYGVNQYIDSPTRVEGTTFYFRLHIVYGSKLLSSDVYTQIVVLPPTTGILMRFTSKIVQSLPVLLRFKK